LTSSALQFYSTDLRNAPIGSSRDTNGYTSCSRPDADILFHTASTQIITNKAAGLEWVEPILKALIRIAVGKVKASLAGHLGAKVNKFGEQQDYV